jgi:ABC-2 type transport system permease protein
VFVLELLIVLTALAALYGAIDSLWQNTAEDSFLLLRLFTVDRTPLLSFVAILGFLIPLMAIGLGFDSINSEHNGRTPSRIPAQPIYRDALLMGKNPGWVRNACDQPDGTVADGVIGLGLIFPGVPPGGEVVARSLAFLVIAIFYAGVWLSLAMLLSIVFRSPATPALVALGIWLFRTVLWPMLGARDQASDRAAGSALCRARTGYAGGYDLGADSGAPVAKPFVRRGNAGGAIAHDAVARPGVLEQLRGAVMGAPLPLGESLMIAWPQTVALIASTIALFVAGYVVFQRQEVRPDTMPRHSASRHVSAEKEMLFAPAQSWGLTR